MRFAIINSRNMVVSIIVWPHGQIIPPKGHRVVVSHVAQPGSIYDPKEGRFLPVGIVLK